MRPVPAGPDEVVLRDATAGDGRRPAQPSPGRLPMWGGEGSGPVRENVLDRGVDVRGRTDGPITARP